MSGRGSSVHFCGSGGWAGVAIKGAVQRISPAGCLGVARSESLARRFGLALGREMQVVGINMVYAPVLDVNTNPENPIIGTRALSDNPEWAARLGKAVIDGIYEAGVIPVGNISLGMVILTETHIWSCLMLIVI